MSKLVTLSQLRTLADRVHTEDEALGARIDAVVADVEGIIATGGEANILEGVKVNGQALTIADKMVDILIASGSENGTISVNGAAVAITGLQNLAYKSEISEAELSEALKASIAAKATDADLQALAVRVGNIEVAGYQNAEQVQTAIQAAIAASGHAHFEEVAAVPSASEAKENVMYLVMNSTTGHYDIYAKVGDAVVLLDDTTVDLSAYAKTADVTAAINSAITGLNIDQYATDTDLNAAIDRIAAVEARFADYYTKTEVDSLFGDYYTRAEANGLFATITELRAVIKDVETLAEDKMDKSDMGAYATDEEAAAAAAAAVTNATASDSEVSSMLDEVFGN